MARPRLRSAVLIGAVLAMTVPVVALANSPALHCGVSQKGFWETIHVPAFKPVDGFNTTDSITAYTVDENTPRDLAATNGTRLQLTTDHGCDWTDSLELSLAPSGTQPFSGAAAKIVSVALLGNRHAVAVAEGAGSAARPHVMVQTGDGSWTTSDSGLPAGGTPKLLRAANDGRTLYLTISPSGGGGGDTTGVTGGLPGLPSGPVTGATGLLYGSTDAGHSWALRTTPIDVPSGGTGFSALDIDSADPNHLYGIVNGAFSVSTDGGASFTSTSETNYTALTAMGSLTVAAFRSDGKVLYSTSGGLSNNHLYPAPSGVTSVGFRLGESGVLIERSGTLERFGIFNGELTAVPSVNAPRTGSLLGDRGDQASFHAITGHSLLRYVDPVDTTVGLPPVAAGDPSVPPPIPGVVVPAVRTVSLPIGTSATEDFTLNLPKNPTPLDLYFLVDVSGSMSDYIDNLKTNIDRIVTSLTRNKVDLAVGLGTLGSGPGKGESEYPTTYAFPPTVNTNTGQVTPGPSYNHPYIYHRIRRVGIVSNLKAVVNQIKIETDGGFPKGVGPDTGREGALLALSQSVTGSGIHTQNQDAIHSPSYAYAVAPGQAAQFRANTSVRKIIILSTDEAFDEPYPQKPQPGTTLADERPDFTLALHDLNAAHAQVIGLSAGSPDSLDDLRHVASGTHTFAPPGGVTCDNGNESGIIEHLNAGAPLVCNNADHFSDAIIRLLSSLVDRQTVKLVALAKSPVLGALQGSALTGLDVKRPNSASFRVNVSCIDVKPGRYTADVATTLRGTKVGSARVVVTCTKAQAIAPPKPIQRPVGNPPPPPANPPAAIVPPVAPPAPAVNPQPQVQLQSQVQVQPLTAGAAQEQQELQLALALAGNVPKDDDPAFNPGTQMAMVDRRKRQEIQAMGVLAFAMTTCAGLGLARLRTKPDVQVRKAR